jgi:hypothetical protein
MNIENLKVGQSFKNYKELCVELGLEIKSSTDTKNAQFKELARFCKFNKVGHKFTIEEVFTIPLPKVDNRGKSDGSRNNNNVYGDMIQLLILDLLAQCKKGHVSISRGKLLLVVSMINENYSFCGENVKKLSKYTQIEESVIYDFYNTSNNNLKSAVDTALSTLMDKRIIWYDIITKVCDRESKIHRSATIQEKEIILECEMNVLKELKYKQISQVRVSKHWRLFKSKVKELLTTNTDIEYYYSAYDIVVNEKYLDEERKELYDFLLETVERNNYKNNLNSIVQTRIIENAEKRHNKAFTSKKMGKFRIKSEYIDDIKRLVNLLIDSNTSDISNHVLNVESDDNLSEEELELLIFEDLFA